MAKRPASGIGKLIRERALSYPETTEEFPWGEHAFKVNRKAFVFMRAEPDDTTFSVKLPHSREVALRLPGSAPTHYGMGAKGWVTLPVDAHSPMDTLYALIDESYRAVAPKRALAMLPKQHGLC